MRIDIVSGFPAILAGPLQESILKRAKAKELVTIQVHDLRDFTTDKHRTIDDAPFGGGAGMVLKPEPVFACIESLQRERAYDEVIYMGAEGETLTQRMANRLSLQNNLILLCGHYKGIDERIKTLVTREISIGDYVLTGGEIPALALTDAVVRLVPGVLNDGESLLGDSFQIDLLGEPVYTRPADFRGMQVPEVLISGDHKQIAAWRDDQRKSKTYERRQDLFEKHSRGEEK